LKIEGTLLVEAPLASVWPALLDAEMMAACIPGCSGIQAVSPTQYRGTVAMKFGPIEPQFEIEVSIQEIVEGVSIASTTRGQEGSRASLLSSNNLVQVRADSPHTTEVSYCATVSVTGRLGKFGLGLMKKTAEKLAMEFGRALSLALQDRVIASRPAVDSPDGPEGLTKGARHPSAE
jgi:uncharacterized protein